MYKLDPWVAQNFSKTVAERELLRRRSRVMFSPHEHGLSYRKIAAEFNLSQETVRIHIKKVERSIKRSERSPAERELNVKYGLGLILALANKNTNRPYDYISSMLSSLTGEDPPKKDWPEGWKIKKSSPAPKSPELTSNERFRFYPGWTTDMNWIEPKDWKW